MLVPEPQLLVAPMPSVRSLLRGWGLASLSLLALPTVGCDLPSLGSKKQDLATASPSLSATKRNRSRPSAPPANKRGLHDGGEKEDAMAEPPHEVGPLDQAQRSVAPAERAQLFILSAPWCQWCQILENTVLVDEQVESFLSDHFVVRHVNVDKDPRWMDLQSVQGLPSLVFFDKNGRFVRALSGFQEVPELLEVLRTFIFEGSSPSAEQTSERKGLQVEAGCLERMPALAERPFSQKAARRLLAEFEKEIFLKINSNDGGFGSPARHPFPDLLRELAAWRSQGSAPKRVSRWLDLSVDSALRGSSPRLSGKPLEDMKYSSTDLRRAARLGPTMGKPWREGVELLPQMDPYLGLQDQIDGGVFRYAAGPGWYHPHFERTALDNLSWALLLRHLGKQKESARIADFVRNTFADAPLLRATQRADAFYYRLTRAERADLSAPPVQRLYRLDVQARAARLWPEEFCPLLDRVSSKRWPLLLWTKQGEMEGAEPAPPDAFGELLIALAGCESPHLSKKGRALGLLAFERWQSSQLPFGAPERLHRLVAGLCQVLPSKCDVALASIDGLDVDLRYAPPLFALASRLASYSSEEPGDEAAALERSDQFVDAHTIVHP